MFEIFKLFKICFDMKTAGISTGIVLISFLGAIEFDGIHDLLILWQKEKDPEERKETIECLIKTLKDCYGEFEND
jgi:hypothetical protein